MELTTSEKINAAVLNSELMVFSKHLKGLPLNDIARSLREMDVHSIDLTVRRKGHVEPEQVLSELPQISKLLSDEGIKIGMITTEITSAESPFAENILKTASQLGIHYYKLGYHRLQSFKTLQSQRDEIKKSFEKLAKLNEKFEIHGAYHNHSGDFFGGTLHDIYEVLRDNDPDWLGFYFDPAHAVIECGVWGWMSGLERLQKHLSLLAFKDFQWVTGGDGYPRSVNQSVKFYPPQQGNTPWREIFGALKSINFKGPISLHSEYEGKHSFRDLNKNELLEQTQKDVLFLRNLLEK